MLGTHNSLFTGNGCNGNSVLFHSSKIDARTFGSIIEQ